MKTKYSIILLITVSFIWISCETNTVNSEISNRVVITVEDDLHYFTIGSTKDSIKITLFNSSDAIITSWYPTYLQLQTDSDWIYIYTKEAGKFGVVEKGQKSIVTEFIRVDSTLLKYYPKGVYRFLCEFHVDPTSITTIPEPVPTNSFNMTYK